MAGLVRAVVSTARLAQVGLLACCLIVGVIGFPSPSVSAATSQPGVFVPLEAPCRALDTRGSIGSVQPEALLTVDLSVCAVPANASAVAGTLTVTDADGPGFVTVWPTTQARPTTSAVNFIGGETRANAIWVGVTAAQVDVMVSVSAAAVIVDVTGFWVPAEGAVAAGRVTAVEPVRVLDTRTADAGFDDLTVNPNVPATAAGVVVSLTVQSPVPSFATLWGSGARPMTSTVNTDTFGVVQTRASGSVIVPVAADGTIRVHRSHPSVAVIVDVVGWVTGTSDAVSDVGLFVPVAPVRLFDTRDRQAQVPAGGRMTVDVFAPAVVGNVTMVSDRPGYVSAVPASTRMFAVTSSTTNRDFGGVSAASALTATSGGQVSVVASHGAHVLYDMTGFLTGPVVPSGQPVPTTPPMRTVVGHTGDLMLAEFALNCLEPIVGGANVWARLGAIGVEWQLQQSSSSSGWSRADLHFVVSDAGVADPVGVINIISAHIDERLEQPCSVIIHEVVHILDFANLPAVYRSLDPAVCGSEGGQLAIEGLAVVSDLFAFGTVYSYRNSADILRCTHDPATQATFYDLWERTEPWIHLSSDQW